MRDRCGLAAFLGMLFLLPLSTLAQISSAPPDTRQPWEWTWEERIAARFDPTEMRKRWIAYEAKRGKVVAEQDAARPVIDGSRNPELFMPSALFSHLLRTSFAPEPHGEFWRQYRQDHVDRLRLGDDFWQQLESLCVEILDRQDRVRELSAGLAEAEAGEKQRIVARIEALQAPLCTMKAEALAAARKTFGRETFDRFLYEAVATGMTQTGSATIADLIRVREGCPAAVQTTGGRTRAVDLDLLAAP